MYYFVSTLQLITYPNFSQVDTVARQSLSYLSKATCWSLPEPGPKAGLLYSRTQLLFSQVRSGNLVAEEATVGGTQMKVSH